MATHSRILAWRTPWTEEAGGPWSTGSLRVGHDWATNTTPCLPNTQGAYSKESSGSTYFWKSIGGDFKASRFRKEEAEEKAREPLHHAGCLCPALRPGSGEKPSVPWTTTRGTAEQYGWALKRREEKRRALSNFAPNRTNICSGVQT